MTDAAVKAFVEERPGMTFVGLLATDAGFSDFLSGEGSLKVQWFHESALSIIYVNETVRVTSVGPVAVAFHSCHQTSQCSRVLHPAFFFVIS